jgi:hypothetical protein
MVRKMKRANARAAATQRIVAAMEVVWIFAGPWRRA